MSSRRLLLAAMLLAAGCADWERGPDPEAPDAAPAPTTDGGAIDDGAAPAGFAPTRAVLLGNCSRCHTPGQTAGKTRFLLGGDAPADYAAAHMFVDVSSPAASRLLVKASGQGHEGGAVLKADSPEYATVLSWIKAGAGL
jgi:mono/diheme cytochrome c family protein